MMLGRRGRRLGRGAVVLGVLSPFVIALGCGGGDNVTIGDGGGTDGITIETGAPDGGDVSAGDGTGGDARDGSKKDGSRDAPADRGVDEGTDASADTGPDRGVDAPADVGTDTGVDTGVDAGDSGDAGQCNPPPLGEWYVAPSGSNATGTGSQACPFQTIAHAIAQLSAASPATTIFVSSGSAGPFVYGAGCTAGGAGCDSTPIVVPDGLPQGILIRGTSTDPSLVDVVGGTAVTDIAVFAVRSPSVSFVNMTVSPRRLATGSGLSRVAGAVGFLLEAPVASAAGEGHLTNLAVDGVVFGAGSESTSSGVWIRGGTSPTVGPAVTITGGDHAVMVSDSPLGPSNPVITSAAGAEVYLHLAQFACVRVETNTAGNTPPSVQLTSTDNATPVRLEDCAGGGIVVDNGSGSVENTSISTSAGSTIVTPWGIRLLHGSGLQAGVLAMPLGATTITLTTVAGIEAIDTSHLDIVNGGVAVTGNRGLGVHIGGTATATIDGLTSSNNGTTTQDHGLLCNSTGQSPNGPTITVQNSVFIGNAGDGVLVAGPPASLSGCTADLGSNGSVGNNTYNVTSQRNGLTGLCYLSQNGTTATPTTSTWSCGVAAGSGCSAGTPVSGFQCSSDTDYSRGALGNLVVTPPQTCCGN
jgi:hypothetical protein